MRRTRETRGKRTGTGACLRGAKHEGRWLTQARLLGNREVPVPQIQKELVEIPPTDSLWFKRAVKSTKTATLEVRGCRTDMSKW